MASKTLIIQVSTLFPILLPHPNSTDFNYPAAFNFGDSNSDTTGLVAGLGFHLVPPNGQTYFQNPSGTLCDGRQIIEFLSKFLTRQIVEFLSKFLTLLLEYLYVVLSCENLFLPNKNVSLQKS